MRLLLTNSLTINRGADDGVTKDMAVVTAQGVVGSVSNVYAHTAQKVALRSSQCRRRLGTATESRGRQS